MNCIYCQHKLLYDFYSDSKTLTPLMSCARYNFEQRHTYHSSKDLKIRRLSINGIVFSFDGLYWNIDGKQTNIKEITKEIIDRKILTYRLLK